jgi:hypothetical protein
MSGDFYTCYCIFISYRKDNIIHQKEHILEDTIEEHYWVDCERDDGEQIVDYHERAHLQKMDQIDYELEAYETIDIYKYNMWQMVDLERERYRNMIKALGISESNLVRMWKGGKCL